MSTWKKYTIYGVSAVALSVMGQGVSFLLTGEWPRISVVLPITASTLALVLVWGFLFLRKEASNPARHTQDLTPAPVEYDEGKVVTVLATAIASIYDNPVSDVYREAATDIAPEVVATVVELVKDQARKEFEASRAGLDYLTNLEKRRTEILDDYTRNVKLYPALAEGSWGALKRVNREIESERRKIERRGQH